MAYLDMNIWIDLARGTHRGDDRWEAACRALREAVDQGSLVLPLSSSHYLELWNRSSTDSRERVAAVMRDLSGYATMAPIQSIRRREISAAVARRHSPNPSSVTTDDLLGHGAKHAFSSPYGRFRFVESLASPDGILPEGDPVAAPEEWDEVTTEGPAWEWINLAGLTDVLASPGLERTPTHRLGNAYLAEELRIRELIQRDREARDRLVDILIVGELQGLTDVINEVCLEAGYDPYRLFLENAGAEDPPSAMREFVAALPSVATVARLRVRKHQDLTHPWDQHDRVDILSLAGAVPYCDVVVTERRWAHLVKASGLASDYSTQVGYGLSGVEALVTATRQ